MSEGKTRIVYTTSVDSKLIRRFRIFCTVNDMYQNEVIEKLIEEFLQREGEGNGDTNK